MSARTLSIIIPNHNYKNYVLEAINSIVNQNIQCFIIFVDDHSTDGSIEFLNDYFHFEGHPSENAEYFSIGKTTIFIMRNQTNLRGPAVTRNEGIRFAWNFTDIFGFLDADDIHLPGKIEKSLKCFDDPAVGAVYSDYENLHAQGVLIREYKEPYSRTRLLQECIINNNSFVTKEALEKAGLYDEELRTCEDYDLWLRVSEHFLLKHIPECLIRHTVHKNNSTSTISSDSWTKNRNRVFQKLIERQGGVIQ